MWWQVFGEVVHWASVPRWDDLSEHMQQLEYPCSAPLHVYTNEVIYCTISYKYHRTLSVQKYKASAAQQNIWKKKYWSCCTFGRECWLYAPLWAHILSGDFLNFIHHLYIILQCTCQVTRWSMTICNCGGHWKVGLSTPRQLPEEVWARHGPLKNNKQICILFKSQPNLMHDTPLERYE